MVMDGLMVKVLFMLGVPNRLICFSIMESDLKLSARL